MQSQISYSIPLPNSFILSKRQNYSTLISTQTKYEFSIVPIPFVKKNQYKIKLYRERQKKWIPGTPRVQFLNLGEVEREMEIVLVQNWQFQIRKIFQFFQGKMGHGDLQAMREILRIGESLYMEYGPFRFTQKMIKGVKGPEIIMWINGDFSKNYPELPIVTITPSRQNQAYRQLQNQHKMILSLLSVLAKQIPKMKAIQQILLQNLQSQKYLTFEYLKQKLDKENTQKENLKQKQMQNHLIFQKVTPKIKNIPKIRRASQVVNFARAPQFIYKRRISNLRKDYELSKSKSKSKSIKNIRNDSKEGNCFGKNRPFIGRFSNLFRQPNNKKFEESKFNLPKCQNCQAKTLSLSTTESDLQMPNPLDFAQKNLTNDLTNAFPNKIEIPIKVPLSNPKQKVPILPIPNNFLYKNDEYHENYGQYIDGGSRKENIDINLNVNSDLNGDVEKQFCWLLSIDNSIVFQKDEQDGDQEQQQNMIWREELQEEINLLL